MSIDQFIPQGTLSLASVIRKNTIPVERLKSGVNKFRVLSIQTMGPEVHKGKWNSFLHALFICRGWSRSSSWGNAGRGRSGRCTWGGWSSVLNGRGGSSTRISITGFQSIVRWSGCASSDVYIHHHLVNLFHSSLISKMSSVYITSYHNVFNQLTSVTSSLLKSKWFHLD